MFERYYRVDRMLNPLRQAELFDHADATLFGKLLGGEEPNEPSLIQHVLKRLAGECKIPIVQVKEVEHGLINMPVPFKTYMKLELGGRIKLSCYHNKLLIAIHKQISASM